MCRQAKAVDAVLVFDEGEEEEAHPTAAAEAPPHPGFFFFLLLTLPACLCVPCLPVCCLVFSRGPVRHAVVGRIGRGQQARHAERTHPLLHQPTHREGGREGARRQALGQTERAAEGVGAGVVCCCQVGILLHLVETFPGVCVIITNLKDRIDSAFLRRMKVGGQAAAAPLSSFLPMTTINPWP